MLQQKKPDDFVIATNTVYSVKFFINELKQISIEDLVKIRKDKYLNITSDI